MSLHAVTPQARLRPPDGYIASATNFGCTEARCRNPGTAEHYECMTQYEDIWYCECAQCIDRYHNAFRIYIHDDRVRYNEDDTGVCSLCVTDTHHVDFALKATDDAIQRRQTR